MLGLGNLEEYCWKLQNEHFRASAWNADNEIQGEIIKKIWKHVACGMSVKNRKKCANRFRILLQKCVGKSGSGPPKPQNEAVEAAPKLRKCRKWASGDPNWAPCFQNVFEERAKTMKKETWNRGPEAWKTRENACFSQRFWNIKQEQTNFGLIRKRWKRVKTRGFEHVLSCGSPKMSPVKPHLSLGMPKTSFRKPKVSTTFAAESRKTRENAWFSQRFGKS